MLTSVFRIMGLVSVGTNLIIWFFLEIVAEWPGEAIHKVGAYS